VSQELDTEHVRKIQLAILDAFDAHCSTSGLRYTLAYGTLLGAIRHAGYIPWDDDIDVMMPRDDYEVLCRSASVGGYSVHSSTGNRDWRLPYAKVSDTTTRVVERTRDPVVVGVNIDVFPVDHVPQSALSRRLRFAVCRALEALGVLRILSPRPHRALWKRLCVGLVQPPARLVSGPTLAQLRTRVARSPAPSSRLAGVVVGSFPWAVPEEWLDDRNRGSFEGRDLRIPANADGVLRRLYGSYQTMPPVEDRETHHTMSAYALEESR
jgi:lipopolysaccharide cholinephosphotransferase